VCNQKKEERKLIPGMKMSMCKCWEVRPSCFRKPQVALLMRAEEIDMAVRPRMAL
jgi:hypothetical protein